MIINVDDLLKLNKKGVYKIENINSGKLYVGSTTRSFKDRVIEHNRDLCKNSHKNCYLQNSWNKYEKSDFLFSILECCENNILEREQYYIDTLNSDYNINRNATNSVDFPPEVIKRRSKTLSETQKKGHDYYLKVKNGVINIDQIPKKYIKMVNQHLNRKDPWNKGKTYESTDHLKVKKTYKSEIQKKKDYEKRSKTNRERTPAIEVFDINMNYLNTWKSITDLYKYSLTEENNLPMVLRNKNGRNNLNPKILSPQNVGKALKNNTTYKGLYFKHESPSQ